MVKRIDGEYSLVHIEGLGDVRVFNDKQMRVGYPVHLSLRPEKLLILADEPQPDPARNIVKGIVEEIIYLGSSTKYWVRVGEYRLAVNRMHRRFLLDEKPIKWNDVVWLEWYSDDGYTLERYSEADEALLSLPDIDEEVEEVPVDITESGDPAAEEPA